METTGSEAHYDAIVVGGGFYGCAVAVYLMEDRGFSKVLIIESENNLMSKASKNNQARVHNGLHYPRSLSTGYSSSRSYRKFIADWPTAIFDSFDHIYCVATMGSKVSATQFEAFANQIGTTLSPINIRNSQLFNPRLISRAYHVSEAAFNVDKLREWATSKIEQLGIEVRFKTTASGVLPASEGLTVEANSDTEMQKLPTKYVFNCTYSELVSWADELVSDGSELKHELAEMVLVETPASITGLGFTVMDGPFFSLMPYPSRTLSTLSHVRYTPHNSWSSSQDPNSRPILQNREPSRFDLMRRDAERYIPELGKVKYADSIFEVKTILQKSELDDSRPILFSQHVSKRGLYSILGGKIDNIYDVFERLDSEELRLDRR